jgi:hypothetical protein
MERLASSQGSDMHSSIEGRKAEEAESMPVISFFAFFIISFEL